MCVDVFKGGGGKGVIGVSCVVISSTYLFYHLKLFPAWPVFDFIMMTYVILLWLYMCSALSSESSVFVHKSGLEFVNPYGTHHMHHSTLM